MSIKNKKLFLFDIDGTLAVGDTLFEGTRELLNYIEEIGGKSYYITNNSTKSNQAYVEKFAKWNLRTEEEQFVTSGYMALAYLRKKFMNKKYLFLEQNLIYRILRNKG